MAKSFPDASPSRPMTPESMPEPKEDRPCDIPADTIEPVGNSLIQHGPLSGRIYLMKMDMDDMPALVGRLRALAQQRGYTKIIAKVPFDALSQFLEAGFVLEARIPQYHRGEQAACFVADYLDEARRKDYDEAEVRRVLTAAQETPYNYPRNTHDPLPLRPEDIPDMVRVYRAVFPTYPFPIHDPGYLAETMDSHVHYFGIRKQGELVALASAEVDKTAWAVEMTDFATLPQYRGQGMAKQLLASMEYHMELLGLMTAFSIARADSMGMNRVFGGFDFHYGGTLINNTNISGGLRCMNVWHKGLADR